MGRSGFIMKKKGEKTVEEVLQDLKVSVTKAGLEYKERDGVYMDQDGVYCATCWIANYFPEEEVHGKVVLLVDLLSAEGQYYEIIDGDEYYTAVMFDSLSDREEILLELLYEYFKINPEDYFQSDYKYTPEDIADLYRREFDLWWLDKDPKIKDNLNKIEEGKHTRPTAGHIIKQSKEKTIYEIIHDVETAAKKTHLRIDVDPELYQNEEWDIYAIVHVTEGASAEGEEGKELLLYILFATRGWGDFEWIEETRNLFRAIIFHKIAGREKMLLDFLDEYFELNPNDYFVDAYTLHEGNKWYYTPEDIKRIKGKDFDDTWCYKKSYTEKLPKRITEVKNGMMGIPAYILKKDESQSAEKILQDVKDAATKAGLELWTDVGHNTHWWEPSAEHAVYHIEGVGDKKWKGKKRRIQVGVRNTGQELRRYDWIRDGGNLIQAVTFTNISDNEEILLMFLREYFKICPEDYFVVGNTELYEESKWYFTQQEIEKIAQCSFFDSLWCYINPHIKIKTWPYNYTEPILLG